MKQVYLFLTSMILALFVVSCVKLSAFEELQEDFLALQIQVAENNTSQNDISALLKSLQDELTTVSSQVEFNTQEITENYEGITDNLELINQIYDELRQADIDNLDVVSALIATETAGLVSQIDGTTLYLEQLIEQRIEENGGEITEQLQSALDQLQVAVESNAAYIESLDNATNIRVSLILEAIENVNDTYDALELRINSIEDVSSRIAALEAASGSNAVLEALVNTLSDNVNDISSDVTSNTLSLLALENRIEAIEAIDFVTQAEFDQLDDDIRAEIEAQVKVVQDALDAHIAATAANTGNIAQNTADIATLTDNLNNSVNDLNNLIDHNRNAINTNVLDIDALETSLATLQGEVNTLTTQVVGIDVELTDLASTVSSNTTNIADNQQDVEDNAQQIIANANAIADNLSSIVSNTANVASNDNEIANIISDILQVRADITSTTESLTMAINAAQLAADNAQTTADSNAAGLSATASDVLAAQATANSAVASVTALETVLDTHVTNYETKVAELETAISANTNNIADNTAGIASNTLNITSLQTSVNGLDSRIADAETNIGSVSSTLSNLGTTVIANHDALNLALGTTSSTIANIQTQINDINDELAIVSATTGTSSLSVQSLTASLTALETALNNAESDISDLETRVSNVEGFEVDILALEASVATLTASATTAADLQAAIDALKTELQDYADTGDTTLATSIDTEITALETAIATAQATATAAQTAAASNTLLITALQNDLTTLETAVNNIDFVDDAELQAALDILSDAVVTATVSEVNVALADFETAINTTLAAIVVAVNANTVGTASNTVALTQLQNDLDALETTVTAIGAHTDVTQIEADITALQTQVATALATAQAAQTAAASNTLEIAALELEVDGINTTLSVTTSTTATGIDLTVNVGGQTQTVSIDNGGADFDSDLLTATATVSGSITTVSIAYDGTEVDSFEIATGSSNTAPTVSLSADALSVYLPGSITFDADAFDSEGDDLTYTWYVNGTDYSGNGNEYIYSRGLLAGTDSGTVFVEVSDGTLTTRSDAVNYEFLLDVDDTGNAWTGWISIPSTVVVGTSYTIDDPAGTTTTTIDVAPSTEEFTLQRTWQPTITGTTTNSIDERRTRTVTINGIEDNPPLVTEEIRTNIIDAMTADPGPLREVGTPVQVANPDYNAPPTIALVNPAPLYTGGGTGPTVAFAVADREGSDLTVRIQWIRTDGGGSGWHTFPGTAVSGSNSIQDFSGGADARYEVYAVDDLGQLSDPVVFTLYRQATPVISAAGGATTFTEGTTYTMNVATLPTSTFITNYTWEISRDAGPWETVVGWDNSASNTWTPDPADIGNVRFRVVDNDGVLHSERGFTVIAAPVVIMFDNPEVTFDTVTRRVTVNLINETAGTTIQWLQGGTAGTAFSSIFSQGSANADGTLTVNAGHEGSWFRVDVRDNGTLIQLAFQPNNFAGTTILIPPSGFVDDPSNDDDDGDGFTDIVENHIGTDYLDDTSIPTQQAFRAQGAAASFIQVRASNGAALLGIPAPLTVGQAVYVRQGNSWYEGTVLGHVSANNTLQITLNGTGVNNGSVPLGGTNVQIFYN